MAFFAITDFGWEFFRHQVPLVVGAERLLCRLCQKVGPLHLRLEPMGSYTGGVMRQQQ
jgi:hypothetical protein